MLDSRLFADGTTISYEGPAVIDWGWAVESPNFACKLNQGAVYGSIAEDGDDSVYEFVG